MGLKTEIVKQYQREFEQSWLAMGEVNRRKVEVLAGKYSHLVSHFLSEAGDYHLYTGKARKPRLDGGGIVRVMPGESCEVWRDFEDSLHAAAEEMGAGYLVAEFTAVAGFAVTEMARHVGAWNFRERIAALRAAAEAAAAEAAPAVAVKKKR